MNSPTGLTDPTPPTARCPECAAPVTPTDRFCETCGTDLHIRATEDPLAGSSIGTEDPLAGSSIGTEDPLAGSSISTGDATLAACRGCGEPVGDEQYCPVCGLRQNSPGDEDRVETDLGAMAGVSDRGKVHHRNEDAMELGLLADGAGCAAVICDGVSTVRTPELAAQAGTKAALAVLTLDPASRTSGLRTTPGEPDTDSASFGDDWTPARSATEQLVADAIEAAAAAVAELGSPGDPTAPSCTLVCARVDAPAEDPLTGSSTAPVITIGWLGDSRAYWLADDGAAEPSQLLSTDHSWAVEMVEAKMMTQEAALADRRAHAITRWLGPEQRHRPDIVRIRPEGSGVLLLCSDGLWNYLPEPAELAAVAVPTETDTPALATARRLTELANEAGGRDNITVVVIPVVVKEPG